MRIELNGATVVFDGSEGAFTLTVGDKSASFTPVSSMPQAKAYTANGINENVSRLSFVDVSSGSKIRTIKCLRDHLRSGDGLMIGLFEAKSVVCDGGSILIETVPGGWLGSNLRKELVKLGKCYNLGNVMKSDLGKEIVYSCS